MRKLWILGFLMCCLLQARAQKEYFFYFQSDNYSAFFLKMNDKVYSSSAEGYLILPRLRDSTYTFSIGRNGAGAVESRFTIAVNQKDRGFLIRDVENRLQLFDLQTLRTIQSQETGIRSGTSFIKKDDPFTRLLALAADDSTLLYVYNEPEKPKAETVKAPVPETETIKDPVRTTSTDEDRAVVQTGRDTAAQANTARQETTQEKTVVRQTVDSAVSVSAAQVAKDTLQTRSSTVAANNAQPVTQKEVQKDTAVTTVAQQKLPDPATVQPETREPRSAGYQRSVITRRSESSTTEGFGLVFLDSYEGAVDTIRLLIPNPKFAYQKHAAEENTETKKFLDVTNETVVPDTIASVPATLVKNACKGVANNADFLRLRRYMAAKQKEEDMVSEAKKYFRSKCFTTEQVKHLSTLFLTDRGKYLFFQAAQQYIADADGFASLESELKDAYFIDRFKVLVGN